MPTKVTKAKVATRKRRTTSPAKSSASKKTTTSVEECNDCNFFTKPLNIDSYLWSLFVGLLVCGFVYYSNTYMSPKLTSDEVSNAVVTGIDKYNQKLAQEQIAAKKAANKQPVIITEDMTDDDPVLGSPDAPVTIVEFADFECPYCSKLYNEAYQEIKTNYIDTGKVKLVFRDFPLSFHKSALPAANAANCIREQGGDKAYFELHDKFYEKPELLKGDLESNFVSEVTKLGYDGDTFTKCMNSNKFADEIANDTKDGNKYGVTGTPAMFIEGYPVVGSQPFSVFEKVIDAALAYEEQQKNK